MNKPTLSQVVRALLSAALGWMLGVLALLGVADGIATGGIGGEWLWRVFEMVPFAAFAAGTVGAALAWRILRNVPGVAVGLACAVVAVGFVAVSLDDPEFKHPLTVDEFSPFVARGNESWELTVRDWPQQKMSALSTASSNAYIRTPISDLEKYAAEVAEKRGAIEEAWPNIAEAREWLEQLNAFPEIGDCTPARIDAPLIKFAPIRSVTQVSCARAALLALDGRGDEAADLLLPVIEVSRKLEPNARTLVRAMIARVMLGSALDSLRFVLTRAEISPDRRAALAVALERGLGGPAGARRLMTIEYVLQYDGYYRLGVPPGVTPSRNGPSLLQRLQQPLFLPRATANLHAANIEEAARFAEKRDLKKLNACESQFVASLVRVQIGNPLGRLVLAMELPAMNKIFESYWKREDERLAMIAELRKRP